jgi:hypothetical protein
MAAGPGRISQVSRNDPPAERNFMPSMKCAGGCDRPAPQVHWMEFLEGFRAIPTEDRVHDALNARSQRARRIEASIFFNKVRISSASCSAVRALSHPPRWDAREAPLARSFSAPVATPLSPERSAAPAVAPANGGLAEVTGSTWCLESPAGFDRNTMRIRLGFCRTWRSAMPRGPFLAPRLRVQAYPLTAPALLKGTLCKRLCRCAQRLD